MELGRTLAGVPIQRSSVGVKNMPKRDAKTPLIRPKETLVWMEACSLSSLWPPKYRAITTLAPMNRPLKKPTSRKMMLEDDATAASASPPRKLPTTSESATLYSCWKRFPQNSGSAKRNRCRPTEPSVIRVVCVCMAIILSGFHYTRGQQWFQAEKNVDLLCFPA